VLSLAVSAVFLCVFSLFSHARHKNFPIEGGVEVKVLFVCLFVWLEPQFAIFCSHCQDLAVAIFPANLFSFSGFRLQLLAFTFALTAYTCCCLETETDGKVISITYQ